ncbi:MAG TPA: hypothetical protein VFZ24_02935 [Longimicrobiales bacterium]
MMRSPWCSAVALAAAVALCACADDGMGPEPDDAAEPVVLDTDAAVPDCGFEGLRACPVITIDRCDHGLQVHDPGTPIDATDDICVNHKRHLAGPGFRGSWTDWALSNQRTLAIDEPIDWVMHLSTHNAYNNVADGYLVPNQVWSMSDQLDLGSRFLWLDLIWARGYVRLCHEVCLGGSRQFAYGMQEIATWVDANPGEIVMIDFEAYVEGHFTEVEEPLKEFFGTKLYGPNDRVDSSRWPTRRELLAMGKQVFIGARGDDSYLGVDNFGNTVHRNYIDGRLDIRYIKNFDLERTAGIVTDCWGIQADDNPAARTYFGHNDGFWVNGEDRSLPGLKVNTGYVEGADVADYAGCNLPLISLDYFGFKRCEVVPGCVELGDILDRAPDEERAPYAVWSWRIDDGGQYGDAALLDGGTGRWQSADVAEPYRFACGRPRSESARDPAAWPDTLGAEWRITTREGTWQEGGRACLEEYGADGFVFSVPVNGRMNGRLRLADATGGDVWLNYNDLKQEGSWVINQRPVAHAGADRVVECNGHGGTPVQLDGTLSSDADGDALVLEWQGPFGTVTGSQPTVLLPLGRTVVTMIADDGYAGVDTDAVVIDVVDTTPPVIHAASATPDELWPANHKMTATTVSVDVSDACDAAPVCRIVSVASNEPANGTGDGDATPDWQITGALTVELRAERSGSGTGRVYTITVECADASGNVARTDVIVTVPHDRSNPR